MKFRFARNFIKFRRKVAKSSEKREIRLHSFCTVLYLINRYNHMLMVVLSSFKQNVIGNFLG